jgi:hypothetical protein
MIRTVWLATICLAVLSTLTVGKAIMTRAYSSVTGQPTGQTTVGIDITQNTSGKADRLEVTYVHQETPTVSALQPAEPVGPTVAFVPPPASGQIVNRHWHDPNIVVSSTKLKQAKQGGSNRKSKADDRKSNQAADRSKRAEPVKPCGRPGAVGDLLRSLNLSPACES